VNDYWASFRNARISRRRALAATGSTAAAALLLAACGGGSSSSSSSKGSNDQSGLVTKAEDSTKDAKQGGVFKDFTTSDPITLDPLNPVNPLNVPAARVYGTLIREKAGLQESSKAELQGDIAESWEVSPDRLTITMKLRQGAKWHDRAPVNGRVVDVDDVKFAFERFAAKAAIRGLFINSVNPQAPILSLTPTDAKTFVVKLKEPVTYAVEMLASFGSLTGDLVMVPKETDSTFDIRRDMIGTGPYALANYTPSQSFTFKRHPDYYDKGFLYPDGVNMPIISEPAALLAQFKAGNIHAFTPNNDDVVTIKKEDPRISLYSTDFTPNINCVTFGKMPDGKTPFLDERVRQAVSMSWDRDLFIDTFYNVSKFQAQGLPVDTRWNTHLHTFWGEWWLDPKGKDFGPNAKYFQRDVAEGKKLLAAAGYANGFPVTSHCIQGPQLGLLPKNAQVLDGFTSDLGLTIKVDGIDYNKDYIPVYRDGNGQYDGWAYHTVSGTTPNRLSPVSSLAASYWSKSGVTFDGFSTTGKNDQAGDPTLDAMIAKARVEPDVKARKTQVYELQRYLAKAMWGLMLPGGATSFTMAWPAVRNWNLYWGGPGVWRGYKVWLDQTKPPFANA
jgi:peptide/nickel transport system substrate-binding protein